MKGSALLIILLLIFSCTKPTEIENFDSSTWKIDKNGCQQKRIKMISRLQEVQFELNGMKEASIKSVLGKPDKTELYERGQRFFIYDITPDPECIENYQGEEIDLILRLNALGIVSEANIQAYEEMNFNQ